MIVCSLFVYVVFLWWMASRLAVAITSNSVVTVVFVYSNMELLVFNIGGKCAHIIENSRYIYCVVSNERERKMWKNKTDNNLKGTFDCTNSNVHVAIIESKLYICIYALKTEH